MDKDNTIGVVVGNTTTDSYSFILTSMKGSKGDLVYTEADIPASESNKPSRKVLVWGRILSINRTNTAFPSEIAQEIASKSPLTTVGNKEMLNYARDHSIQDGLNYVATWNAAMLSRADLGEAFIAKKEKRDPLFIDLARSRKTV